MLKEHTQCSSVLGCVGMDIGEIPGSLRTIGGVHQSLDEHPCIIKDVNATVGNVELLWAWLTDVIELLLQISYFRKVG